MFGADATGGWALPRSMVDSGKLGFLRGLQGQVFQPTGKKLPAAEVLNVALWLPSTGYRESQIHPMRGATS